MRDEAILERRPLWPREFRELGSRDLVELLSGAIRVGIRSNASHEAQVMPPLPAIERERRVVLQGQPDLSLWAQNVLESGRHDADNGDRIVVEQDLTSDDGRIGPEAPTP